MTWKRKSLLTIASAVVAAIMGIAFIYCELQPLSEDLPVTMSRTIPAKFLEKRDKFITAPPPVDKLAIELLATCRVVRKNWNWQRGDYKQAQKILTSLFVLDNPRYANLLADLAKYDTKQQWVTNSRALIDVLELVKEQNSPLHPEQVWETFNIVKDLPQTRAQMMDALKQSPRRYWRRLLQKITAIQKQLRQLPHVNCPYRVEEMIRDLRDYDAVASENLRDQGTILRLLIIYKIYTKLCSPGK